MASADARDSIPWMRREPVPQILRDMAGVKATTSRVDPTSAMMHTAGKGGESLWTAIRDRALALGRMSFDDINAEMARRAEQRAASKATPRVSPTATGKCDVEMAALSLSSMLRWRVEPARAIARVVLAQRLTEATRQAMAIFDGFWRAQTKAASDCLQQCVLNVSDCLQAMVAALPDIGRDFWRRDVKETRTAEIELSDAMALAGQHMVSYHRVQTDLVKELHACELAQNPSLVEATRVLFLLADLSAIWRHEIVRGLPMTMAPLVNQEGQKHLSIIGAGTLGPDTERLIALVLDEFDDAWARYYGISYASVEPDVPFVREGDDAMDLSSDEPPIRGAPSAAVPALLSEGSPVPQRAFDDLLRELFDDVLRHDDPRMPETMPDMPGPGGHDNVYQSIMAWASDFYVNESLVETDTDPALRFLDAIEAVWKECIMAPPLDSDPVR